jgi:ssDNA-binding Zn-finger/Zn-ribbon topoisomerase 1
MAQKLARITSPCPECRETVEADGVVLMKADRLRVRCPKCGHEFHISLIPDILQEPSHYPKATPSKLLPLPQDSSKEKKPSTDAPKPMTVPFAPVGAGSQSSGSGLTPLTPLSQKEGEEAQAPKTGFNALPLWLQYTLLAIMIIVIAVGIFLSPLGEKPGSGNAEKEESSSTR